MYSTFITRQVIYSLWRPLLLKHAGSRHYRSAYFWLRCIIGTDFHLFYSYWWFHNALKILVRASWILNLIICCYVIISWIMGTLPSKFTQRYVTKPSTPSLPLDVLQYFEWPHTWKALKGHFERTNNYDLEGDFRYVEKEMRIKTSACIWFPNFWHHKIYL